MLNNELIQSKPFEIDISENPQEVAEKVFSLWKELANSTEGEFYVAAPLSSTPLLLYQMIINRSDEINHWENFRFLFMDEMLEENGEGYVSREDDASYVSFAIEYLLGPLAKKYNLDLSQIMMLPELETFDDFERRLNEHGGLDLLVLATGAGGHFAQVVPGTPLDTGFHIADLNKIPGYAEKHENGAYKGATFRDKGMSLGYRQVRGSQKTILMLTGNGADKIEASTELFSPQRSRFTGEFPISILYHPEVAKKTKVFVSKEALGE